MGEIGFAATPLPRKLGIREGSDVAVVDDPGNAGELLGRLPDGAQLGAQPDDAHVVVWFVTERRVLERELRSLAGATFPDRSLWIAWPKRTSGVATDMTEDVVREVALPLGLVDNKVCAIDTIWSGLRLVWRRELRTSAAVPVRSTELDRQVPDTGEGSR